MDPFSLTVGILTLLGAGGTIGKALKKIITLNPPDVLLALNNEVNDLQIVVQNVSDLLHQHSKVTQAAQISSISFALEKSKRTLATLESTIAYELTTTTGKENELRLDRYAWFRQERKVLRIKNDIRDDRFRLLEALIVLTTSTSLGINAQIRQPFFTVESVSLDIGAACGEPVSQMQDLSSLVQDSLVSSTRQGSAHGGFHDEQRTAAAADTEVPIYDPSCVSHQSTPSSRDLALTQKPGPSGYNASQIAKPTSFHITGKYCNLNCRCSCHKKGSLKSPKFLTTILGSIMVGYNAMPGLSQRCNNPSCRAQSTNITCTYVFPKWFVSRVLYVNFRKEQLRGPELCLRVARVRPRDAAIFIAMEDEREGHVLEYIKRLLLAGEASVLDVNPQGNTLLKMAIRWYKFDLMDLLINAGSDIFYEDDEGQSPCTLAWQKLLSSSCDEEGERRLRHHFHDDSQLVALDLPDLTRAFFNLSGRGFHDVLASTQRSAIDDTDCAGMTTLAWAARQGDEDAVKALVACGADPNHRDRIGMTPLHMSMHAKTPECSRLLLNAKADVDIKDNHGDTALALAVQFKDRIVFSELLLAHGADIECTSIVDFTPLRLAARNEHPKQVSLLLGKGANINASAPDGQTALCIAIAFRRSAVVKVLLDNPGLDYRRQSNYGHTAIHQAALRADMETLEILKAANLGNIDLDAVDADGDTALDCARWRRYNNEGWANWALEPRDEDPEAWYQAFMKLIYSILISQGKLVLGDSECQCPICLSRPSVGDDPAGNEDQQDEEDECYDTAEEGD